LAGPLGVLLVDRQQAPPKLKTLMAGPLGDSVGRPTAATTEVEDVDGGPPGGCCRYTDIGHHRS
jgi:hypothetical protein